MREKIPAARRKGLLEGLVRSLRVCLFVGKQIGTHCRPYRLGDSETMVGLESWRTLCCCLRWRLCFLLRRWNYCSRVEGYDRATLRHFLLLGVVFSSPSKQRNGVFLSSSASMPPITSIAFSRKTPCVGVSSPVACSPSSPSGSKNRMVCKAFRKVVVAKRLHMYSPCGKSVVFFVALFPGAQIFCRQFLANSPRRVSYSSHLDPRSCKNASLPLSGADTTWMGFHTLRASLAIYHLVSNAGSWNNCQLSFFALLSLRFKTAF